MGWAGLKLRLIPGRFVRVRVPASLEPSIRRVAVRMHAPFFVSLAGEAPTLIALEDEWDRESGALPGAQVERGFCLLSLESPRGAADAVALRRSQEWLRSHLPGSAAEVLWLSSFHRDYLLAREEEVPRILAVLEEA